MNKEFIQYTEALELKELGFDEPCFAYYEVNHIIKNNYRLRFVEHEETNPLLNNYKSKHVIAPTFSQAFRWFREKYGLHKHICYFNDTNVWHGDLYKLANGGLMNAPMELTGYKTYEEAELACLRKLIEIVKEQKENDTRRNKD